MKEIYRTNREGISREELEQDYIPEQQIKTPPTGRSPFQRITKALEGAKYVFLGKG